MKRKIDYECKSRLIGSPIMKDYLFIKKECSKYMNGVEGSSEEAFKKALDLEDYYLKNFYNDYKECGRIDCSRYKKAVRVKKRISNIILSSNCLFLTLTFRDKVLLNSCFETRRKYVLDFLNSFNVDYVANIDFGKKNGREHYHAVLGIEHIDYSLWLYGAINGIVIRNSTEDVTRISKYIAKLSNHALKNTTRNFDILYSRGTKL